jgi:hypothetical protein
VHSSAQPDGPLTLLIHSAAEGDADAQFNLAALLLDVPGGLQGDEEAVKWLTLAAKQGHLKAISRLGTLRRLGRGIPQDYASAAELHGIAASDGDPDARSSLADYVDEIKRTALEGSALAALCLGKMYHRGLGVERDNNKAVAWLRWCQERCVGGADADVLDEAADMRSFLLMFMTPDDKQRASRLFKRFSVPLRSKDGRDNSV